MTERRFRADAALPERGRVTLGPGAARHARVLRLEVGDAVVVFDGRGAEADAVIAEVGDELAVDLRERRASREPWEVALVLGLPKAAALEGALRGATEAGASTIHVFAAARSVSQPGDERGARKLERWTRIVSEAARQSERAVVPEVSFHASLEKALAAVPAGARVIALDARAGGDLVAVLATTRRASLALVVGPEGGLALEELAIVEARGGTVARAALPVLRVETAAVVATALGALASVGQRGDADPPGGDPDPGDQMR